MSPIPFKDKMKNELSQDFRTFYDYVFGDYRFYHYNGLPEEICTTLKGAEREQAEKLLLSAVKNKHDTRSVRASGHLRIKPAIPLLEKRLRSIRAKVNQDYRSSIIWALLKIKGDKKNLEYLINTIVSAPNAIAGLARNDAANLLSEFGEEQSAIDALLQAFIDRDLSVSSSALFALRKIYRNYSEILSLFDPMSFALSLEVRKQKVRDFQLLIRSNSLTQIS